MPRDGLSILKACSYIFYLKWVFGSQVTWNFVVPDPNVWWWILLFLCILVETNSGFVIVSHAEFGCCEGAHFCTSLPNSFRKDIFFFADSELPTNSQVHCAPHKSCLQAVFLWNLKKEKEKIVNQLNPSAFVFLAVLAKILVSGIITRNRRQNPHIAIWLGPGRWTGRRRGLGHSHNNLSHTESIASELNDLADITLIVNWVCSRDTGGMILICQ